jgi:hypothetical protein
MELSKDFLGCVAVSLTCADKARPDKINRPMRGNIFIKLDLKKDKITARRGIMQYFSISRLSI